MIRHIGISIVAATILSSPAFAAPPKERGFFLGGAIGSSTLDDDGAFAWYELDDSDTSLTLFAGYKFIPYFGIEARIGDLGTYSISNGFFTESAKITSRSLHAVGLIPFGQSGWELYGQLGLGTVDFDCSACSDETVASAGIGIRYSFTRQFALGVQVDAYAWEDDDDYDYYDMSIATTQLVLQFLF